MNLAYFILENEASVADSLANTENYTEVSFKNKTNFKNHLDKWCKFNVIVSVHLLWLVTKGDATFVGKFVNKIFTFDNIQTKDFTGTMSSFMFNLEKSECNVILI